MLSPLRPTGNKCGLRSYKTEPIVWDNHNCEHEWGQEIIKALAHGQGETNPGKEGYTKDAGAWSDKQGNFCLKCHAWKGELGLEPTIELYVSHLLQIFDEVKRVLKRTGTLWVNIGDSYAANRSYQVPDSKWRDVGNDMPMVVPQGIPAKSLCLIPECFALGMVERGWILRNNIIWYKSNPMPESVKDRFTGTYEYLYFFVKNKRYWFEQQFEKASDNSHGGGLEHEFRTGKVLYGITAHQGLMNAQPAGIVGRNKRDVWEINTEPYPEAHFATFPEKLVETPILSGCPSAICKKCGKVRERIYEQQKPPEWAYNKARECDDPLVRVSPLGHSGKASGQKMQNWLNEHPPIDKGYTDCGCNEGFEPGLVLDPFAGSGATGAVAKRFAREYIGIELSKEYCKLHKSRLQAVPLAMELV